MSRQPGGTRWLLPVVTLALLVIGTAIIAVALTVALTDSDTRGTQHAPAGATPVTPRPEPPAQPGDAPTNLSSGAAPGPVSELVEPAWIASTSKAADLPERALAAYAGAAIAVGRTHPGCGLGWNTLAAIGLVESEHGSIGKSSLHASGATRPPIIGVALDGKAVAAIRDTDRGLLDEDATWDRAVGPMQFIPTTWSAHATDGNDDGKADIHNLDDAAMTAAVYLCTTGGDLTRPDDWIAAVSAYNPDTSYNAEVAAAATAYSEARG
jgi:membrane-bound lytic murein transglycosylase B